MNGVEIIAIRIDKRRLHDTCRVRRDNARDGLVDPNYNRSWRHFTALNLSVSKIDGDKRLK